MPKLTEMMGQARQLKKQLSQNKKALNKLRVIGSSPVKGVEVLMNGHGKALDVRIEEQVLADRALLVKALVGAFNNAVEQLDATRAEQAAALQKKLNLPPGMKTPFDL